MATQGGAIREQAESVAGLRHDLASVRALLESVSDRVEQIVVCWSKKGRGAKLREVEQSDGNEGVQKLISGGGLVVKLMDGEDPGGDKPDVVASRGKSS